MLRLRLTRQPALAGLLLAAAGCTTSQSYSPRENLSVIPNGALPTPTANDMPGGSAQFVLAPLDRLRVDVLGVPELSNREIQVDGAGKIAFPYAGTLTAAGQTTEQLVETIERALKDSYFRDPVVTVNLVQAAPRSYTVYGEVRDPGLYQADSSTTLMRAIASAKGLGEFGKQEDVIVFRRVGGQDYAAIYNLAAIRAGAYEDPRIYPNDVVAVGDSPARRRFKDLISLAPTLVTPIILLLQNN